MTHIGTYSGRLVDIEAPKEDDFLLEDIAHALPFLCRGSGQCSTFFSVAQHCILCAREAEARGYSREVVLACLLHDASEAYMVDVPRPIKRNLIPEYIRYENALLSCIYRKFIGRDLTEAELAHVEKTDDDLLQYDLRYLLSREVDLPPIHVTPDYTFPGFEAVREEYLELAHRLGI